MSRSDGSVTLHDVMEWAQDQAQYLSPSQTLVLWYLCINAFRSSDNPEGRSAGDVMSGRVSMRKIQMRTGLGERTVRDALRDLQEMAYLRAEMVPGNGHSRISVFWEPGFDELRSEIRAGVRPLPKAFQRVAKGRPERVEKQEDAVVLEFRKPG